MTPIPTRSPQDRTGPVHVRLKLALPPTPQVVRNSDNRDLRHTRESGLVTIPKMTANSASDGEWVRGMREGLGGLYPRGFTLG